MVPADSPYTTIGAADVGLAGATRSVHRRRRITERRTGPPDVDAAGRGRRIDPRQVNYLAHDGGGELLPALLANQFDFATSGVREYTEQIKSGQLRVLAVSGETRVPNVDAPTLTESGIDLVFANWRGVIAPPGITHGERERLIDIFTSSIRLRNGRRN